MTPPQNIFIFFPMFNERANAANPSGNDATGEFQPRAAQFGAYWTAQDPSNTSVSACPFNNHFSERKRFDQVLFGLQIAPYQLDTIVYLGHGQSDMLASPLIGNGFLAEFADSLMANCGQNPTIILYACSCGAPNGFASKLAAKMAPSAPTIYAHSVAGVASTNPMVYRFPGNQRVAPPQLGIKFQTALARKGSDLWLRFPFMTSDELTQELTYLPGKGI